MRAPRRLCRRTSFGIMNLRCGWLLDPVSFVAITALYGIFRVLDPIDRVGNVEREARTS